MTQLVSDIRILDNLLALNLNVSLWSARRKMSQEDLGGAELPPEDLAKVDHIEWKLDWKPVLTACLYPKKS